MDDVADLGELVGVSAVILAYIAVSGDEEAAQSEDFVVEGGHDGLKMMNGARPALDVVPRVRRPGLQPQILRSIVPELSAGLPVMTRKRGTLSLTTTG